MERLHSRLTNILDLRTAELRAQEVAAMTAEFIGAFDMLMDPLHDLNFTVLGEVQTVVRESAETVAEMEARAKELSERTQYLSGDEEAAR